MGVNRIDELEQLLSKDPGHGEARRPAAPPVRRPQGRDWPVIIGNIAVGLLIASFGGVVWAINGGFSVIGLQLLSESFNDYGRLFWAAMTAITFQVPVRVAGLPVVQPLIPWLGVLGTSALQIIVVYMQLRGRKVPPLLYGTAIIMSLYDYGTTLRGLGIVSWLADTHWLVRGMIAVPLTFAFETIAGVLLGRGLRR